MMPPFYQTGSDANQDLLTRQTNPQLLSQLQRKRIAL